METAVGIVTANHAKFANGLEQRDRHCVGQAECIGGAGGERGPAMRDELAVKSWERRRVAVPNFRDADTASLPFLESVPAVSAKLKDPVTADRKFEEVVKSAQDAAILVLVY